MNMKEAVEWCLESNGETQEGWVFCDDDNNIFWCNQKPTRMDGFWGNNQRGFSTIYVGLYTGDLFWTETLREVK